MSHKYAKFKENPCVCTDVSTPFNSTPGIVTNSNGNAFYEIQLRNIN